MKPTLLILAVALLMGCNEPEHVHTKENSIPVRPLVIYNKHTYSGDDGQLISSYSYYDANGKFNDEFGLRLTFSDLPNKYSIGDTIK